MPYLSIVFGKGFANRCSGLPAIIACASTRDREGFGFIGNEAVAE
jgi:hypothetical protein